MFDVVWTDPQRESVGEHRARKENERKQKTTDAARTLAYSRSNNTTPSSECPSEKSENTFSSLFSSRTIRRVAKSATKIRPLSPSIQSSSSCDDSKRKLSFFGLESIASASSKLGEKPRSITSQSSLQRSAYHLDTDITSHRSESRAQSRLSFSQSSMSNISDNGPSSSTLAIPKLRQPQQNLTIHTVDHFLSNRFLDESQDMEDPTSPISRDSVFSKCTAPSIYTQSTAFDLSSETSHHYGSSVDSKYPSRIHAARQSSITTLASRTTGAPSQAMDDRHDMSIPRRTISIGDSVSLLTSPETSHIGETPHTLQSAIYNNSNFKNLINTSNPSSKATSINTVDLEDFPVDFSPLSSLQAPINPTGWVQAFGPNDQSSWRTPDEWEDEISHDTMAETKVNLEDLLADEDTLPHQPFRKPTLEERFQEIQIATKMMQSVGDQAILTALNRNWGSEKDAAVYKEMEMEKKRWMLTAIHNIDQEETRRSSTVSPSLKLKGSHSQRIMCLFESPGMISFISANNPTKQIFHVANSVAHVPPVFSNVISVQVPSVSPAHIPDSGHIFGEVYAYSLPAALTVSEIPIALDRIYNCLAPGGVLHLALVDPTPIERTTGPLLRQWLSKNLTRTTMRQFRCSTPSKSFRKWLHNADLRGPGSTITTASCKAILPSERKKLFRSSVSMVIHEEPDELSTPRASFVSGIGNLTDLEAKSELRHLTGRLLWKQTWSRFVGAHKWWWEYPEVLQECMEYDTTWEYHLIEAVRA